MKTYKVTYTEDLGTTLKEMVVEALDYTKAYLSAIKALPITIIITAVCEV